MTQAPRSAYREVPPSPALADHVLCVWSQVIGTGSAPYRQRVLPDGCVDLVWIGEAAVVAGPATRATRVALMPGSVVIGVRLQRVLALAGRSHGREPLAGLAAVAGYADQAHMSRELRALAGSSPRALLPGASSTLELSDLFKTAATPAL